MIPQYVASEVFNPFTQSPRSYSGGIVVARVRQPSVTEDGTIDPSLLMYGDHEPLPQHDPYIFGDSHHQRLSPAPSNSTEVWMGHPGELASASAPSPISPMGSSMDVTHPTFMDSCICGCGGGACIPQREYDRQRTDPLSPQELQAMILFRVNGRCGYPLADALKKQYTGLDGRDERMFADFKSSISIRLEWLAYEKWTKQIRTLTWRKTPDPDHISRAKLATEVAKRMKSFFEEMQVKQADQSHWEYRVRPGIVDLEHLELVALKRVSKSSWMPHFRLIAPSQPSQSL